METFLECSMQFLVASHSGSVSYGLRFSFSDEPDRLYTCWPEMTACSCILGTYESSHSLDFVWGFILFI